MKFILLSIFFMIAVYLPTKRSVGTHTPPTTCPTERPHGDKQ